MNLIHKILILLFGVAICVQAVPPVLNYAGQVAVNGEAFDGNGLFKFALVNADGKSTYWSNDGTSVHGSEPQASVAVPVNGGLYSILLGNTAQQGMGAIDPAVFAQHTDAKLRVWFSDGVNGFQQLSPDRPFASVPYAFSAGIAGSVNITNGAITKSMLGEEILSDLNRTITKQMLGQDVLSDLNRIVTPEMIQASSITTSQLNEQILKYLRPEITSQPQAQTVYADTNVSYSATAEGKYLTYQWKKDGVDLVGETNATLNITDTNATLHDGNYSVVVSNDFGSEESEEILVDVNTTWSTDGLVGWWPFEGNASDISGNENHALLVNGPTFTDGKIGSALQMDGSDDRMNIPNTVLNNVPEFSISMWFRKSTNSTDTHFHIFISVANSEHTNRFILEHKGDFGWFQLIDSPSGQRVFEKNIYPDSQYWNEQWRKITLVRDSGGTSMFVSGKLQIREDYQTSAFQVPQNGLWVGPDQDAIGGGWQSTQHLKGDIDDLRIYDRALSAEEVQALYNLGQ
jgi:hypothetical protein